MKFIFIALFNVILVYYTHAQLVISGSVTDDKGNIMESIPVKLINTGEIAETDQFGNYYFRNLIAGKYTISVSVNYFNQYEMEITLLSDQIVDIVLQKKSVLLKDITINGTRSDSKMPFTYQNINKENLEKSNYGEDIPYLLDSSPSVVASSDGGTGMGYTGIWVRGSDPTRINVTINNIPLNDAESQQVYWVDLPDLTGSVENIQIQRGVGTSTNGAGAFGASINILTGKINPKSYLTIDGSYGSFNSRKLSASAGTGLMNDKFSIDMRYSLLGTDGYIERAKASMNSFYASLSSVSENSSLRFNVFLGKENTYQAWDGVPVHYIKIDSLRNYNVQGTDYFQKYPAYDNQIDNYTQNHYQLFYNKKLNDKLLLNLAAHYTRGYGYYEQYKVDEDLANYKIDTNIVKSSDLVRQKWLSNHFYGTVYNLKYVTESTEFVLGGALNSYNGSHFGVVTAVANLPKYDSEEVYYLNKSTKSDFNIYGKVNKKLSILNLYLDLQYRQVNYKFNGDDDDGRSIEGNYTDKFFNPKFGINAQLTNKINIFSSIAIGNKEPNRVDYISAENNKLPKSENLTDIELGFRFSEKHFSFQINSYYMKYKNQLVLTGKVDNVGNPIRENVDKSLRAGIETEAIWKPTQYLSLGGNLTVSKNKIEEFTQYVQVWDEPFIPEQRQLKNTDISYSPNVISAVNIEFDLLRMLHENTKSSLKFNLSNKFVGKQYIDNSSNDIASLDSYNFTDFILSYSSSFKFLNKIEFSLKIGNLFNSLYSSNGYASNFISKNYNPVPDDPYTIKTSSSGEYYYMGLFPQAPRNFMFRMKIDLQ